MVREYGAKEAAFWRMFSKWQLIWVCLKHGQIYRTSNLIFLVGKKFAITQQALPTLIQKNRIHTRFNGYLIIALILNKALFNNI